VFTGLAESTEPGQGKSLQSIVYLHQRPGCEFAIANNSLHNNSTALGCDTGKAVSSPPLGWLEGDITFAKKTEQLHAENSVAEAHKMIKDVVDLEKATWDRQDAKEDMGSAT
jgi:hypothetical protein